MVWEKHVGRVGALAVALGIGSAVFAAPGTVWAQPEGSAGVSDGPTGGAGAESGAEPSAPTTAVAEESGALTGKSEGLDDEALGDASGLDDPDSDDPELDEGATLDDALDEELSSEVEDLDDDLDQAPDEGLDESEAAGSSDIDFGQQELVDRAGAPSRTVRTPEPEQGVAEFDDSPSDTVDTAEGVADTGPDTAPDAPTQPAQPAEPSTAGVGTPGDEDLAQTPSTELTALSVSSPSASDGDGPPAPASSPLLLTLLASAWRSLTERIEAAQTASAVSSAAPPAADAGVNATSAPIPGGTHQSPVIAADGTVYQVTDGGGTTRVSILDSDGQVITATEFDGIATRARATTRPDGTLVVVTASEGRWSTTVRAVDSEGNVTRLATVFGLADSPLTVGADGALYFSTVIRPLADDLPSIDYRFVRISANNFTRSYSYDTDFELTPDGTAHLVSSRFGFSTLRTIYSSGWTRASLLPFGSDPSAPLVDQEGVVYVTAGVQGLFGTKSTRVYTIDGASRTVRSVVGLPGEMVSTAGGFSLETFTFDGYTDDGTGTTYISTVTADDIVTSEAIDGRIEGLQVGANGTAYAPIVDPAGDDTAVAVIDPDGGVLIVTLPGTLAVGDRGQRIRGGATQSADDHGYVNYTADGVEYVAVLGPDATVVETIELPPGAHGTVFFGPDGSAFELLRYYGPSAGEPGRQILALSTGAYTPVVPGYSSPDDADVVFGPDGVGYVLVSGPVAYETNILGFNAAGDTVIPLTSFTSPALGTGAEGDTIVVVFGPDSTPYVVDRSQADSGVYALTPSGRQKVADLEYSVLGTSALPTFSADGTGYVATDVYPDDGGGFHTIVTTFSPPASAPATI